MESEISNRSYRKVSFSHAVADQGGGSSLGLKEPPFCSLNNRKWVLLG